MASSVPVLQAPSYADAKASADKAYRDNDLSNAIRLYTQCISLVPEGPEAGRKKAILHSNTSMCCLKQGNVDDALSHANKSINFDSSFWKSHMRKALAISAKHDMLVKQHYPPNGMRPPMKFFSFLPEDRELEIGIVEMQVLDSCYDALHCDDHSVTEIAVFVDKFMIYVENRQVHPDVENHPKVLELFIAAIQWSDEAALTVGHRNYLMRFFKALIKGTCDTLLAEMQHDLTEGSDTRASFSDPTVEKFIKLGMIEATWVSAAIRPTDGPLQYYYFYLFKYLANSRNSFARFKELGIIEFIVSALTKRVKTHTRKMEMHDETMYEQMYGVLGNVAYFATPSELEYMRQLGALKFIDEHEYTGL